ncbi:MAG: metal ABC transporter substrate-binding protein [Candidatus Colwellbacteria bacterium]|jgi:zinc transport system substrate-binding protein|nr:metal ABC transporter substrate-binding protein [Candidatus Colwellbacteria bacterium]MCK9497400.1 metal ABC transporter substrate-binding protein [Candidatus Colwellbacteria bacterium]MDD3752565.1 metal ABC transporter substrate-binding protein [Candidatus Colwellbacteria bacterium]MDD4818635.1 metal ABC transporter substrate-binding protein [Candidatus Colwellbacteria bacterium]
MKKALPVLIFFLIAMFAFSFFLKTEKEITSGNKVKVGATIIPIDSIVREIGGDRVESILIVPEGASPHTFDPDPETIRKLSGSSVIFKIGVIDDWVLNIADSLEIEDFFVGNNISLKSHEKEKAVVIGKNEEHKEGEFDPHYWLSIPNGKIIAENIANKLIEADPAGKEYYKGGLENFVSAADEKDTEIRSILSGVSGKKIITFHNAWSYFADEYGFEIAAVYQSSPGKEPLPKDVKNLVDVARENGIKVFFSEAQSSPAPLEAVGESADIEIIPLDPLGAEGYLSSLVNNARTIRDSFSL